MSLSCVYYVYLLKKNGHDRAIRPCHPIGHSARLALVLPKQGSMILFTKTSDQTRRRGHRALVLSLKLLLKL